MRRTPISFLYIGPPKSASTWLYEVFRAHPRIYVPEVKDIYFFDREHERGLAWYNRFFEKAPPDVQAIGELSHDYIYSPDAARRIHDAVPDAVLLTILRNPLDRAQSEWLYYRRSNPGPDDFEAGVKRMPVFLDHSLYAKHLRPYRELFGPERVKICFYDDLLADPEAFSREILAAVGVEYLPGLPVGERVLPAAEARNALIGRAVKQGANLARTLGLAGLVGRIKRSSARELVYRPMAVGDKPDLSPEFRAQLSTFFQDDVAEIERWTGRSLRHWL